MILVPVNRGLQMARRLLHTSRAHMESCLFRELKKSPAPMFPMPHHHHGYVSDPPFVSHQPPQSLSCHKQAWGLRSKHLFKELFFLFVLFFFFSPFSSSFQALFTEVAYLKDSPEGKCTLMRLLLHCPRSQCCLAPALPAGPAAGFVCQSV